MSKLTIERCPCCDGEMVRVIKDRICYCGNPDCIYSVVADEINSHNLLSMKLQIETKEFEGIQYASRILLLDGDDMSPDVREELAAGSKRIADELKALNKRFLAMDGSDNYGR